jgi:hypothetical protein
MASTSSDEFAVAELPAKVGQRFELLQRKPELVK